jgi:hypothetical protein
MTKTDALDFYKTRRALAKALNLREHSINTWPGDTVPPIHQLRLERLTGYALLADEVAWEPAPATFSDEHRSLFARTWRRIRNMMKRRK